MPTQEEIARGGLSVVLVLHRPEAYEPYTHETDLEKAITDCGEANLARIDAAMGHRSIDAQRRPLYLLGDGGWDRQAAKESVVWGGFQFTVPHGLDLRNEAVQDYVLQHRGTAVEPVRHAEVDASIAGEGARCKVEVVQYALERKWTLERLDISEVNHTGDVTANYTELWACPPGRSHISRDSRS